MSITKILAKDVNKFTFTEFKINYQELDKVVYPKDFYYNKYGL